jgi:hypothetical protein
MTGKKMKFIKILMLLIFFAVLLLGLFMLFFVRGLSYRYSIRPRQVYAGDPVTVKLTFLAAKGIQAGPVGFTGKKDTLNIEPRNSVIFDARFFKIISKEYLITEYVPGDYTVTGMSIKSSDDGGATWSETILPDQGFTVKSVLPDDFDAGPSKIRISGALKQGRS